MPALPSVLALSVLCICVSPGHARYPGYHQAGMPGILTQKRSPEASPDAEPGMPDGLDLSVSIPFDMLRRRYLQALTREHSRAQVPT